MTEDKRDGDEGVPSQDASRPAFGGPRRRRDVRVNAFITLQRSPRRAPQAAAQPICSPRRVAETCERQLRDRNINAQPAKSDAQLHK